MRRRTITVNDKMQQGYRYTLSEPVGRNFDPEFKPELTPKEMLRLGVFGGKYMTDCRREFPASWFRRAKANAAARSAQRVRASPARVTLTPTRPRIVGANRPRMRDRAVRPKCCFTIDDPSEGRTHWVRR